MVSEQKLLNKIKVMDKVEDKVLFIRLYEYYKNNCYNKDLKNKNITLLDIKKSYENIKANLVSTAKFNNKKINNLINNYFEILQTHINCFKVEDKESLNKTLELITHIEVLMGLSISFPRFVLYCLEKKLNEEGCL